MRAKYERVKRVNELIMDQMTDTRPQEVQDLMTETFKENLQKPEFCGLRMMAREFDAGDNTRRKTIRNFGHKAAAETIGSLGIFLSQFSDEQIRMAVNLCRKRRVERLWR